MIVKNEGHQLAEALSSFQSFADEIIVVDTGSTDNTKKVAQQFTSSVYDFPWCDSFSAARNASLQKATCDCILWLDADDRIEPGDQDKIRSLKRHFKDDRAFYFILQDMDDSGPTYSFYQLRCIPRRPDVRFYGRVHEKLTLPGLTLANTDIAIHHHGYKDQALFSQKVRRNFELLEQELEEGRDDEHIHFYLAHSYDHFGRQDDAIASMSKYAARLEQQERYTDGASDDSLSVLPMLAQASLFMAERHLRQGQTSQALRHMVKAHALAGEDTQIVFGLACLYQQLGRHPEALAHLKLAINSKCELTVLPRKPLSKGSILVQMAYSFLCLSQGASADLCIREAGENGMDLGKSWEQIGFTALKGGEHASSLTAYERALQTGDLSADGFCNMGLLYGKKGEVQQALHCYEQALQRVPEHADALANMAHLRLSLGHYEAARQAFRQLTSSGRQELDILLALALIAVKERNTREINDLLPLLQREAGMPDSSSLDSRQIFGEMSRRLRSKGKNVLAKWAEEIANLS